MDVFDYFASRFRIHGNFNNYILGDGAFDQFISHLLNNTEMQQRGLSDEQLAKFPEVKISEEQVKGEFQASSCSLWSYLVASYPLMISAFSVRLAWKRSLRTSRLYSSRANMCSTKTAFFPG